MVGLKLNPTDPVLGLQLIDFYLFLLFFPTHAGVLNPARVRDVNCYCDYDSWMG